MLLIVEDVMCGDVVSFSASEGLFELNLNRGEQIWPSATVGLPPQAYRNALPTITNRVHGLILMLMMKDRCHRCQR